MLTFYIRLSTAVTLLQSVNGCVINQKLTIFGRIWKQAQQKSNYFVLFSFVDWKAVNIKNNKNSKYKNNLQHKKLTKTTTLLLFIIDHGGKKMHYNGTTTDFIVYSVPKLIGNQLPMVESNEIRN